MYVRGVSLGPLLYLQIVVNSAAEFDEVIE